MHVLNSQFFFFFAVGTFKKTVSESVLRLGKLMVIIPRHKIWFITGTKCYWRTKGMTRTVDALQFHITFQIWRNWGSVLNSDHSLSAMILADEYNIRKSTVYRIVTEDLRDKKHDIFITTTRRPTQPSLSQSV